MYSHYLNINTYSIVDHVVWIHFELSSFSKSFFHKWTLSKIVFHQHISFFLDFRLRFACFLHFRGIFQEIGKCSKKGRRKCEKDFANFFSKIQNFLLEFETRWRFFFFSPSLFFTKISIFGASSTLQKTRKSFNILDRNRYAFVSSLQNKHIFLSLLLNRIWMNSTRDI